MKRNTLTFLLTILMSMAASVASAYQAQIDGIYYNFSGDEAIVTNGRDCSGSIVIPESVNFNGKTYTVTHINYSAFYGCSGLTAITIPNSVTNIGDYAFYGCSGLTAITIPNSVTSIGYRAFAGCSGLTAITIPNSVTSIGSSAFSDCSGLTTVDILDGVKSIEPDTFYGCSGLTSVTIPESVTIIGSGAFVGCSGLTSVTIPESVTIIGSVAFAGCSGLRAITIPESVTIINSGVFRGCSGLTTVAIPDGVKSIEPDTFYGCSGLTSVTIPESVTIIGSGAFVDCSGLTSVTIPNSVTSIGSDAFYGCSGLTSVTIPESVTIIGSGTFVGCSGLTSVKVAKANRKYDSRNDCNAIIEKATNTLICGCQNTIIPESVTSIAYGAFQGCSSLTSVTIPDGVTTIGNNAFQGCSSLTSVTIPDGVTKIGNYAFQGCSGLTSISIPNSVTSIGNGAFASCSGLISINVAEGNTKYDSRNGCNAIIETAINTLINGCQSTIIPESVTSIGDYAFYGCSGLTSVTIPNSVQDIGSYTFRGGPLILISNREVPPSANSASFEEGSIAIVPKSLVSLYENAPGWKNISINKGFTIAGTTQTSITLSVSDLVNDCYVTLDNSEDATHYYPQGKSLKITGLSPSKTYTLYTHCKYNATDLDYALSTKTSGIYVNMSLVNSTNLTQTIKGSYDAGDAEITEFGFVGYSTNISQITIEDLKPGAEYNYEYYVVSSDGSRFSNTASFSTKPVTANVKVDKVGASYSRILGNYDVEDAVITDYGFEHYPQLTVAEIHGLDPDNEYTTYFYVETKDGTKITKNVTFKTKSLTLTPQQPKVISDGNVIVAATTNLDDEETGVGFEWRRIDWTNDFDSRTGGAYLYEGTMEGYIRSINSNFLWKFRPYYTSSAGNTYYGEWKGMDPSDYSYFEPTVHTYATINVQGNRAEVKGYAMRGTDNVVSQGFMYWESNTSVSLRKRAASVPNGAKVVNASGNVMTATLEDLEYETTYKYVAFVTTSEGETFYGEQQTFSTSADPDGIEEMKASKDAVEVARYDIHGRKIANPQRGINIIRFSDGSSRKVLVK